MTNKPAKFSSSGQKPILHIWYRMHDPIASISHKLSPVQASLFPVHIYCKPPAVNRIWQKAQLKKHHHILSSQSPPDTCSTSFAEENCTLPAISFRSSLTSNTCHSLMIAFHNYRVLSTSRAASMFEVLWSEQYNIAKERWMVLNRCQIDPACEWSLKKEENLNDDAQSDVLLANCILFANQ